jgi:deoxyribose-phosphate aldolase
MRRRGERAVEVACRAARESGCDGAMSGSATGDATGEVLALMKKYGESLTIKAQVINDPSAARAALEAGADRVGTEDPAAVLMDEA